MALWTTPNKTIGLELSEDVRNSTVTVGTASVELCKANKRQMYIIQNISTGGQNITIRMGEGTAVAGYGITIGPGTMWIDCNGEGYNCFQGRILGIASAAGGSVAITER